MDRRGRAQQQRDLLGADTVMRAGNDEFLNHDSSEGAGEEDTDSRNI